MGKQENKDMVSDMCHGKHSFDQPWLLGMVLYTKSHCRKRFIEL